MSYELKSNAIILGIDPGIADTGWGVISRGAKDELTCLDYGSIRTKAKDNLSYRLEVLHTELKDIINKYKPRLIGVEEIYFAKNVKTALIVGHARGVVLLTARQSKIPTIEFTPLQIKQAVAAYGQAGKLQVQKMVKLLLNLKTLPKPDDAADALAVAICAANTNIHKF